jgi:homoserine kinase type II
MFDLSYVLNCYPVDCRSAEIVALGSGGGMSGAALWRLSTPRGDLVLRRWPPEHPSPERLSFIHDVLYHAARRGATFLPLPIATSNGRSFVEHAGHLWELAPWLPGVADYEQAPRPAKLCAALTTLAQFHEATTDWKQADRASEDTATALTKLKQPSPGIARRLTRLQELQAGGASELASAVTDTVWPALALSARQFVALLPRSVPIALRLLAPLADVPLALQPCIRDIWHDHVLFVGDEVTGLVDFGAIDVDLPAGDVARLLGSLVGDDPEGWQRGLDAYTAVRPLSAEDRQAIVALDASGTVLAGCNWIRWIYVDGREFADRPQVERRFRRLLGRLQLLVQRGGSILETVPHLSHPMHGIEDGTSGI